MHKNKKNPETSIIIRTFNEGKHLGNLLKAVRSQDYKNYEIVLVDSGSTDDTLKIAKDFKCDSILEIEKRDFTFGYSLNYGCRRSKGKYIVLISAHALPKDNYWLSNLLAPFKNAKVGMVYGSQFGHESSRFSEKRDFLKNHYPNNANSAFLKKLWQERKFDEYLFGLEDIDWARRMTASGHLLHYEPKAAIYHIHEEKWHQIFNRYRREAIAAVRMGLPSPPQAKPGFFWLANNVFKDVLVSLPNVSLARLEEISLFRYFQWKGTRQGWLYDKDIDLQREKYSLFYPAVYQAVMIENNRKARLKEMTLPDMKPGDILVRVDYAGICRTDLEVYEGTLGYYRDGLARYPIVPGHEFAGTIVKIGASNRYRELLRTGERVIGECVLSRDDKKRREVGVINCNGAYSQFIVMPGEYLHKIPQNVDSKTACLAEPLAVVLRALRRIKNRLDGKDNFAVIGAGPIGNLCSQVLSGLGYQVAVFDKNKDRLGILKNKVKETFQTVRNLKSFNVIIEATGSRDVLELILKESKLDATILLLGFPYGNINYNFEDLIGHEKFVVGSVGGEKDDFDEALKLLPQIDTAHFVQKVMPLEEFSNAWKLQKAAKHLKIILKP